MKKLDLTQFKWINKPKKYNVSKDKLEIITQAKTDFWQRTHYGFQNDNAPAFLCEIKEDFTLVTKTEFNSKKTYDQCGLIIYIDSDNWFKASVEYEETDDARLGSVVTNLGYSDWATTDISSTITTMWYRLSRKGQDFYIESSLDGINYKQMRIFHLHKVNDAVNLGFYACSPLDSSFKATFSEFEITECRWEEYKA